MTSVFEEFFFVQPTAKGGKMRQRLQKIISAEGLASRRTAEEWIRQGRVRVNGIIAELGAQADPDIDEILVDDKAIQRRPNPVYIMLNKPRGFVTTLSDERGRPTVADLVADCGERVYPAGRLDLYSEGLLILTNNGETANRLTHPSHRVEKVYLVWVSAWQPKAFSILKYPIHLREATVQAACLRLLAAHGDTALLEITIREGKNRQIRRMCQAAGLTVTRLRRIREGRISLGELPAGKWRRLTDAEIAYLQSL